MRILIVTLIFLTSILVGACDFWPQELKPLAESITRRVSGETTAWLVGGDVLIIDVAGSPLYRESAASELEALATGIAEEAVAFAKTPLESIVITFHEGGVSDDPENMREFIFLIMDGRPVLQPGVHTDATGPVTLDELRAAVDRTGDALTEEQRQCVLQDAMKRADIAGDPEALAPSKVEFLSTLRPETWNALDPSSKRIFAVQAIITKALFACAAAHAAE